jgi:hypothetical protein
MGHGRITPRLFLSIMLGTACTSSCSSLPLSARSKHLCMDIRPQWLRRCLSHRTLDVFCCRVLPSSLRASLGASSPSAPTFPCLLPFASSCSIPRASGAATRPRCSKAQHAPAQLVPSSYRPLSSSGLATAGTSQSQLVYCHLCSAAYSPKQCPLSLCHSTHGCCSSKSVLTKRANSTRAARQSSQASSHPRVAYTGDTPAGS